MPRPKPSPRLRAEFQRNRVRRTVIDGQIKRLSDEIRQGMRELRSGSLKGAALANKEKRVLAATEQRLELRKERARLRVRRKPKKKGSRTRSSSGGQVELL